MIYIQKLQWSNWFSYGASNELEFTNTSLLQICGANGTGKSSIPIILEETLFGKNSKGIKKADIPNRAIDSAAVDSVVYFLAEDIQYEVHLHRKGASTKLTLIQDKEDISSHTATGTYTQIANILGLDYKLYSQLTYQSSTSSLQFLKATDTERKKFLISLFNLDDYLALHEQFKNEHKVVSSKTTYISGQADSSSKWLASHKDMDLTEKPFQELPIVESSDIDELSALSNSLTNIKSNNVKINKNNAYKVKLEEIDKDLLIYKEDAPAESALSNIEGDIKVEAANLARVNRELKLLEAKSIDKTCSSCGQTIHAENVADMVEKLKKEASTSKYKTDGFSETLVVVKASVAAYKKHRSAVDEFEKLSNYIDDSLPEEIDSEEDLEVSITAIKAKIRDRESEVKKVSLKNAEATAHNAKIEILSEELKTHTEKLSSLFSEQTSLQNKMAVLATLKDAFGTTGLLTYKLEFVVKALEEEINNYLVELSSGRFQILFVLVKDKLNIEIIDNGTNISINALSTGELARVNTSTVLAIRKLMSNISKTKLNLLFLDEIMGVLDEEGKDTLIALLIKENLNTLIVSHEFQHPLVPQVLVSKNEQDIASIEKVNG